MGRLAVCEALRNAVPVIAPSLLKCDFGNLHREVQLLEEARAPVLHLDVMDGHFVPNLSYGPPVIECVRQLTRLPLDAHLMISDPARYLDDYLSAGCDLITFHIEAEPEPTELLRRIRAGGAAAGLALNPGTPVSALLPFAAECDLILVMSVQPGFGGQKFQPQAVEKLRQLRADIPETVLLSVDGGIGVETIGSTAAAGAQLFVTGSSVFHAASYRMAIQELRAAACRTGPLRVVE